MGQKCDICGKPKSNTHRVLYHQDLYPGLVLLLIKKGYIKRCKFCDRTYLLNRTFEHMRRYHDHPEHMKSLIEKITVQRLQQKQNKEESDLEFDIECCIEINQPTMIYATKEKPKIIYNIPPKRG